MRRGLGVLCVWFVAAGSALGQPLAARVDGRAAHATVATLASPEWEGRRTLTPGFDKASEWAASRFREWGLKPAGEAGTYFQAVAITGARSDFAWTTGMPAFAVGERAFSFRQGDFVVDTSSTAATDVTAEAVFVGYGISAPGKGLDEYAGLDASGKVVFVLRGSPKDVPPEMTDFPGDPLPEPPWRDWRDESRDAAKIDAAYRHGAAAVVLCEADPEKRQAAPWPKAALAPTPFSRPFLVLAARDPGILRSLLWRSPGESLPGYIDRVNRLRRSIQHGVAMSSATGVQVRVKGFDQVAIYGESVGRGVSRNVLAKIEGVDPTLKSQAVVVGAHLDHLGWRGGLVHPGADDNASGSAVVLEVARTLASSGLRPKRTIVFALWCGEEIGHYGSKRFTAAPADGLAIDRIVAYINMDMVGIGTGIEAAGARDFPAVFSIMMRDQPPEIVRAVTPEIVGPGGSDYAPFIDHGVDAISLNTIGGRGHQDYHDAADVPARIQPEMLALVGQFVVQAAANLAGETRAALPVPGRGVVCDSVRFAPLDLARDQPGRWRTHPAATAGDLAAAVVARIGALKHPVEGAAQAADDEDDDEPVPAIYSGMRASAVDGNLALLVAAKAALEIGRLDVGPDDSAWVKGGLTAAGVQMVRAAGDAGLTVALVRPSPLLAGDVVKASKGPLLVTSARQVDPALVSRLKGTAAVLAIDCDPAAPDACAAELQARRADLGVGSLMVTMTADQAALRAARRALYSALAAKGWTRPEIFAIAGQEPDGRAGGNLSRVAAR